MTDPAPTQIRSDRVDMIVQSWPKGFWARVDLGFPLGFGFMGGATFFLVCGMAVGKALSWL